MSLEEEKRREPEWMRDASSLESRSPSQPQRPQRADARWRTRRRKQKRVHAEEGYLLMH